MESQKSQLEDMIKLLDNELRKYSWGKNPFRRESERKYLEAIEERLSQYQKDYKMLTGRYY